MKACPICDDRGPWGSAGERLAHIRGHQRVTCPDCGQSFDHQSALVGHQRYTCPGPPAPAAEPELPPIEAPATAAGLPCPECGKTFGSPAGLGRHRSAKHGVKGTSGSTASTRRRRAREVAETDQAVELERQRQIDAMRALAELLPAAGPELVCRLADFVARHQPDRAHWLVTTLADGPWICRPGQIGLVATRFHTPVIAVAVTDIYTHLEQPAAEQEAT